MSSTAKHLVRLYERDPRERLAEFTLYADAARSFVETLGMESSMPGSRRFGSIVISISEPFFEALPLASGG